MSQHTEVTLINTVSVEYKNIIVIFNMEDGDLCSIYVVVVVVVVLV